MGLDGIIALSGLGALVVFYGAIGLGFYLKTHKSSPSVNYSQWVAYAKNHTLTARITFDQFLSYYNLAPQEWKIAPISVYHVAEDGNDIYVIFSRRDFRRYSKFYKNHSDPNNKGTAALLAQIQEDIDAVRQQAIEEREKAIAQLNQYVNDHMTKGGH